MGVRSALSSLVPRRRGADVAVRSNREVRRFSLTDYLGMVAENWQYAGNLYPTAAYGVTTTQNGQQAEPVNSSFVGYCEGLLYADGPVAAVEAMRLRVFSQAPLLFQEITKGRPGDLYDDESLNLARAPWVGGTTSDLQKRALLFADMGGNAYIVEVDDELVVLRPDWVQIILEPRMHNGYQVGWRQVGITYTEGGVGAARPAAFLRGEYCHFAPLPDPLATYRGMSWLTPVIREVMTDKAATEHRLAFMGNAATPNLAVKIPQVMEKEQFEEFVDTMDSQHRGPSSAGKTLYYAGGADVTVVGATMQQMEFTDLLGKSETRVANAGGIHPVIVGFSEGMGGSSLNAGNYQSAKRATIDTTFRDLWQNWCGSFQVLFQPPTKGHRLWYDHLDIPFLSEDAKDLASIQQTQAATIASLVVQGFKPDSAVAMVRADDLTLLEHTGLTSVQLLPPGQEQGADGSVSADQAAVDAAARALVRAIDAEDEDDEVVRAIVWALEEVERGEFNSAAHPRNPKGSVGGGRFRSLADRVVDALKAHETSGGKGDPFEGFNREQLRKVAKARGIALPRGASRDFIGERLLEHHAAAKVETAASDKHATTDVRRVGEDLIAKDAGALADRVARDQGKYRSADGALSVIAHEQGFDGKPRAATGAEIDKLVADGAHEIFRGVGSGTEHDPKFPNDPHAARRITAAQVNDQLRTGDAYFGVGIYGNGYYFTSGESIATDDYSDGSTGSVVRAVLPKDAKVADTHALQAEHAKFHMSETGRPGSNAYKTYGDLGRYAAARGYDALRHEVGSTDPPTYNYVILNRSALVVQEG